MPQQHWSLMDGWNVITRTSCNFHRVAPLVFTKIFELEKNFQIWFPCKQTDEIIKSGNFLDGSFKFYLKSLAARMQGIPFGCYIRKSVFC